MFDFQRLRWMEPPRTVIEFRILIFLTMASYFHSFQNLFKEPVILISGNVSSTANQTSTANITSTINGAIITTCSSVTGTTCHMTAASATWSQSQHGVEHAAAAATCITTAAILETRTTSMDTGPQRQTGKSTTSQKTPGGTYVLQIV